MRYRQDQVRLNGWAIECRINAEDPYEGFMPSTGVISHILQPTGPGVRIDSGVYPGFEVSPFYDSMIAKLVVWGEARSEAVLRMRRALDEYRIVGLRTNIPFHQRLMDSHRFMAGQFDTRFVEERFTLDEQVDPLQEQVAAIMATLVAHQNAQRAAQVVRRGDRDASNWKRLGRWDCTRR